MWRLLSLLPLSDLPFGKAYRRLKRAFNALEKTRKSYASLERRIRKREEELSNGKAT